MMSKNRRLSIKLIVKEIRSMKIFISSEKRTVTVSKNQNFVEESVQRR